MEGAHGQADRYDTFRSPFEALNRCEEERIIAGLRKGVDTTEMERRVLASMRLRDNAFQRPLTWPHAMV
jgi:hypothetical protein